MQKRLQSGQLDCFEAVFCAFGAKIAIAFGTNMLSIYEASKRNLKN